MQLGWDCSATGREDKRDSGSVKLCVHTKNDEIEISKDYAELSYPPEYGVVHPLQSTKHIICHDTIS